MKNWRPDTSAQRCQTIRTRQNYRQRLACWQVLVISTNSGETLTQLGLISRHSDFAECNAEVQDDSSDYELRRVFGGDLQNGCELRGYPTIMLTSGNIEQTCGEKRPLVTEALQERANDEASDEFADGCKGVHLQSVYQQRVRNEQ